MEVKQDIKKQLYTLAGLATAVSLLTLFIGSIAFKVDDIRDELEYQRTAMEETEKRLNFFDSTIKSRNVMDQSQNTRLDRIEEAVFVPRSTKVNYEF